MTQEPDFCDVSHWNGAIDWPRVAATGILGAIAKCTDGTGFVDDHYQANRAGALGSGLVFASYHYLQHGSADRQMEFYLAKATPRQGERLVIDYEEQDPAVTTTDLKEAIAYIRAERPDLQLTVYGASKLTEDVNKLDDFTWLAETSLWAARYSEQNQPIIAKAWPIWSAWQYTDSGHLDGIGGEVDLNVFNGSIEACIAWFGPAAEVPLPVPEPEIAAVAQILRAYGREVAVHIEADGSVSIWIDGEQVPG